MLQQSFIEEMKQKLLAEQQRLEEEIKGRPTHTEIDTDPEATQDEAETDFDNQGIREALLTDLKKVEAALQKIAAGTYGTDDEGKEISEERLRALPWADKAI